MIPTIGRIVLYETDRRNGYRYALPAIVVRTRASTDPKAVADGKVAALPDDTTVDLFVMSVGGESYGENGVPYGDAREAALDNPGASVEQAPRTWRWAPKYTPADSIGCVSVDERRAH